ncbi:MAG: RNA polymerase sigma-70 factor [Tannerellaceae bacterium]|nr:RNA polymerase sigma-70 factor [Tannerellaceae bacterium]
MAKNHSTTALKSLYRIYRVPITRYITQYVHSQEETEELLSDVFLAVWENRDLLGEIENFNAWIYKIARNKCLNHLRNEPVHTIDLNEIPVDLFRHTETTAEDDLIARETIDKLNKAIEALPPRCKLAFKLVREDKMKYKEAADHLNISVKTLENQLTTAIRKLKETLKGL